MLTNKELDEILVLRFQHGESSAFNLLTDKYKGRLFRVVLRLVHNPSDAEDVVQEALISAYRALPSFRREAAFYTWLFQIAINGAKKLLKAQSTRRNVSVQLGEDEDGELEDIGGVDELSPLSILENKRDISALDHALRQLPNTMATAILLRELEGLSYEEIAAVMGCPVGTVRSRIFRARELLASSMGYLVRVPDMDARASCRQREQA